MKIIDSINENWMKKAKLILEKDGVLVLPTDTNYNLICDASSEIAINKIFKIKGRDRHNPLSLFFSNPEDWRLYGFSKNNAAVEKVIKKFWPGPLNIILNKTNLVPDCILNGGGTVALGCISNTVWQKVVSYYGKPITLTSANRSGEAKDVLVTKEMALEHVGSHVDLFFSDDFEKDTTKSSTIIDFTDNDFRIIRSGDIKSKQIRDIIDVPS